jgi:L-glyceraldehyde 3-phosphate reductase
MKTRRLGRTELKVSELVFGGGWVGGILIDADDDTRRSALQQSLAAGINWIDTASKYGQGASEQALGWLLSEIKKKPHISTKVSLDVDNLDDIGGQIERQLEQSLTRLQCDRVDLYQLHNPIADQTGARRLGVEAILGTNGVADTLDTLKSQGLFDHVGMTALGDTNAIIEVVNSGRFDTAQVYYNMINPSAALAMSSGFGSQRFDGLIRACRDQDMGVMAIRIFAAGVLATGERHGREVIVTQNTAIAEEESRSRLVFDALGISESEQAKTAIRFGLSQPDIACIVFGLANLDHLTQALAAAEAGPLDASMLSTLDKIYATMT